MGIEIERKFLVHQDLLPITEGIFYRQGYLNSNKERTVRVRTIDNEGFITVKGITKGMTRQEYEYSIPKRDADEMLDTLCEKPLIEKQRSKIEVSGYYFEIDQFFGENEGLVVAEVELTSEEESFPHPNWLGKEVTNDPRYYNSNLIKNPFRSW